MGRDKNVFSLLSDSGTDYDVMMARDFPAQCFNFGIAEQNKVAAASGMAALGKIPFVYTTGAFLAYRSYEFIRNDVCLQNRNVKLVGMGMGLSGWSTLGPSHHGTEDIAALRALPNLMLLSAATPLELAQMVEYAYEYKGAVYIRMGMSAEEDLHSTDYKFAPGQISKLFDGNEIAVFTTGTVAAEVYRACEKLGAELWNISTIKPLDANGILAAVNGKRKVFTVEEHQLNGGIGGAVAEVLAEHNAKVPLVRIGLNDRFAHGYGKSEEIRKLNGLDCRGIYEQISKSLFESGGENYG